MPFLYIYSPDDFVEGLPAESGSMAAGTPPFTLTLKVGATPTLVEVTDDDLIFDEVDGDQVLTSAVTIDGDPFSAGTSINTAYDLIDTSSGHKLTSLHFGGNGYQQGAMDGAVSTVELVPGTSYTFDSERTSHQKNNLYEDYVACFASGTHIATPDGPRTVESLRPGDEITRADGGVAVLRLMLSRHVPESELAARPKMRPVRIAAGALGPGLPGRDLWVSPQHRMLVSSPIVRRVCGDVEALLAATKLTAVDGVDIDLTRPNVTYHHLIFDAHEIIFAEGAPTESFYPGPQAIAQLSQDAREELSALFPDFLAVGYLPDDHFPPARAIPNGRKQRAIATRHAKHAKVLVNLSLNVNAGLDRSSPAPVHIGPEV